MIYKKYGSAPLWLHTVTFEHTLHTHITELHWNIIIQHFNNAYNLGSSVWRIGNTVTLIVYYSIRQYRECIEVNMFWWLVLAGVIYYLWERHRRSSLIENIQQKCVMITGCDSGFGRALATKLDTLGCSVIAGCFTEKAAAELKVASSDKFKTVQIDITDPDSVRKAYTFVKNNLPSEGKYSQPFSFSDLCFVFHYRCGIWECHPFVQVIMNY